MTTAGPDFPLVGEWQNLGEERPFLCRSLSFSARSSSWRPKVGVILIHLIFGSSLFLLDADLVWNSGYAIMYVMLTGATLVQYLFTACSTPGYAIDALRTSGRSHANYTKSSVHSNEDSLLQTSSSTSCQVDSLSWFIEVKDLYPLGSSSRRWTCTNCNFIQPPRSKHCHDCDKCVLQFDHHCAWLGACVGKGNHCRFWWYIFEETILCTWTCILYLIILQSNNNAWWKHVILMLLFSALVLFNIFLLVLLLFHSYLALTNKTTYEFLRRQRISYLKGIPEKVNPFSRGICKNLYFFCFSRESLFTQEPLLSAEEIEARGGGPIHTAILFSHHAQSIAMIVKSVFQFGHHCAWLGTCVGKIGNQIIQNQSWMTELMLPQSLLAGKRSLRHLPNSKLKF